MKKIESLSELKKELKINQKTYLLLYKSGSEAGECAYNNIYNLKDCEAEVLTADVNFVRDIHGEYSVKTVPVLLDFESGNLKNVYKGCNDENFYKSLMSNKIYASKATDNEVKQPSVTVYSTPSCSWCTRLKNYLKENSVKFRDVDVSKDQKAAEAMVKRSGQQGVPQSIIAGQVIVGFDKPKIDKLLGL